MARDFSKTNTDQLIRSYRFHDQDRGTMTFEEECRRMCIVDEIAAELQRRGVSLNFAREIYQPLQWGE